MNKILLPRFQDGRSPYDMYGTVGDYYPVGQYNDYYNPLTAQRQSSAELIRDYLFGLQYGRYDNLINTLNYLMSVFNYSDDVGAKQRGPYKGEVKPRKTAVRNSNKLTNLKSKRDFYSKFIKTDEK